MKAAILTETNNGAYYNNYRSLGAHIIKRIFHDNDADATVIDYATHWKDEDLVDLLSSFFKDSDDNVIGISLPIRSPWDNDEDSAMGQMLRVARAVRSSHSNVRIIIGGMRVVNEKQIELYKDIDGVFIGRADEMLRDWIANTDMTRFNRTKDNNIFTNLNYDLDKEKPVLFDLFQPDDCLNEKDVIGFEVSLGCKFNCSFCNYPMRNAKNVVLNTEEAMLYTFKTAYEQYGITNFFAADDTLNESNEKLELLVKVVQQLDFTPKISAYARLDVIMNRPEQIEMIKQAGIVSLNFGIETLSPEGAKQIKKGYNFEKYVKTLTEIKKQIPEFWSSCSFIVGLKGDTFENLKSKINLMISKGLIDNLVMSELLIYHAKHPEAKSAVVWDEGWLADLDINPDKFGYEVHDDGSWSTDYTNESEAKDWKNEFVSKAMANSVFVAVDAFTWSSVLSMGIGDNKSVWRDVKDHEGMTFAMLNHKLKVYSFKHINKYIRNKKEWINSLN
jgi:hypothetical protein